MLAVVFAFLEKRVNPLVWRWKQLYWVSSEIFSSHEWSSSSSVGEEEEEVVVTCSYPSSSGTDAALSHPLVSHTDAQGTLYCLPHSLSNTWLTWNGTYVKFRHKNCLVRFWKRSVTFCLTLEPWSPGRRSVWSTTQLRPPSLETFSLCKLVSGWAVALIISPWCR